MEESLEHISKESMEIFRKIIPSPGESNIVEFPHPSGERRVMTLQREEHPSRMLHVCVLYEEVGGAPDVFGRLELRIKCGTNLLCAALAECHAGAEFINDEGKPIREYYESSNELSGKKAMDGVVFGKKELVSCLPLECGVKEFEEILQEVEKQLPPSDKGPQR